MHMFAAALFTLISVITPSRVWYPPAQPMTVQVKSDGDASLMLTDFDGKQLPAKSSTEFSKEKNVDLKELWPALETPGTYVLYEVPKGKPLAQFEGTPMVIEVRSDQTRGGAGGAEVTHIGPLEYAVINTDQGPITCMFYYDVAPLTVASFLDLSRTGYYDSLTFHRVAQLHRLRPRDIGNGCGEENCRHSARRRQRAGWETSYAAGHQNRSGEAGDG
jgi:hypothetical protein